MPVKKKNADLGHTEHSKGSHVAKGLEGVMPRPIKLAFIGAGSFFTSNLVNDLLCIPGHQGGELALVDLDAARLDAMLQVVRRLLAHYGQEGRWRVSGSVDRRKVMAGADYLINCIEVSGLECVRHDNDIPAKYGVNQCIGDTIGPGGLFKGLRTIPAWLDILRDAEELCPGALVLNYTNPMNMMCLAANRTSRMAVVGLCHSVQGTSRLLARRAGVDYPELEWDCAGINHLAWFTTLKHKGRDLYPRLMKQAQAELYGDAAKSTNAHRPDIGHDLVRKDMMLHFGAFITESSGHLSEYLPYYRKRPGVLRRYARKRYDGESNFYANNWPRWRQNVDRFRDEIVAGTRPAGAERSMEYASFIIEAREKNVPFRIHGNVPNTQDGAGPLISNLSPDSCVEVACLVDRQGIRPVRHGALPPQMAALCESNVRMFDLAAQAAIERSVEKAVHALMLDPLTAAVCSPAQIKAMTLELFAAEKRFLPGYR